MTDQQTDKQQNPQQSQPERGRWLPTLMQARLMIICVGAMVLTGLIALFIIRALESFGALSSVTDRHTLSAITIFVGILVGIVISWTLIAAFMHPIKEFVRATRRVQQGDFTVRVEENPWGGDLLALQQSFNQMVEELQNKEIFSIDFINDFSHEFKTPIVNIHGFAGELLSSDITEEQRREYSQIIFDESQRLADLSSNVLLLSKVESQQILVLREPIDLGEMIRRSIVSLQNMWEEKDLEFEIDLCDATITGNPDLLFRVWQNLLDNAIKFSSQGGKIIVASAVQGENVEVTIGDEGPGMDEETAARAFEKFFQGDASRASQGNGIGLSLVKRAVELHGGKVELYTTPGAGSVFAVILPIG